jgi:hypothetical protein
VPTHRELPRFQREFQGLTPEQQRRFLEAMRQFRSDLRSGPAAIRPSLRVKRLTAHPGLWEMTWAPDGRATFEYGDEVVPGQPHVIWRRVGTHDIFQEP